MRITAQLFYLMAGLENYNSSDELLRLCIWPSKDKALLDSRMPLENPLQLCWRDMVVVVP